MVEVWHARLQIRRQKDDCTWNKGLNWSRRDRASDRKARTTDVQSGSLSGAATIVRRQERNTSKTSTGPSGARRRWLQIDNHHYSLSWFLVLLLSSFPNYSILYWKLFINVFHLQQSAQVLNYPKTLLISNDWFFIWRTPRCCWSSVAFVWNVERQRLKMEVKQLENLKAADENPNHGLMRCREVSDLDTSSPVESFSVQLWKKNLYAA